MTTKTELTPAQIALADRVGSVLNEARLSVGDSVEVLLSIAMTGVVKTAPDVEEVWKAWQQIKLSVELALPRRAGSS